MLTNLVRILESILIYYLQEGLFLKNPMKKGENFEKNSNDYINNISYNVMYKF